MSSAMRTFLRNRKLAALAVVLLLLDEEEEEEEEEERRRCNRREWVNPYILRRYDRETDHNLFMELAFQDPNQFQRCLRMDAESFEWLLEQVTPLIKRRDTNMRAAISPAERLSVTLRHLATGESQESLRTQFRIGQSTISGIIRDVVRAIIRVLQPQYLRMPQNEAEWLAIAEGFETLWDLPNCIGAIDGKHFKVDPPLHCIALLAVVDAQLRFTYADVRSNETMSDSGIWGKCSLKRAIHEGTLHIPPPRNVAGFDLPYVIVGDEGFPLTEKVLIPYPKAQCSGRRDRRVFNYRLSRSRRCSENSFGVLVARFQIFRSAMRYDPDFAANIVTATLCIHNWLRTTDIRTNMYTPASFLDTEDDDGNVLAGDWRQHTGNGVVNLAQQGGNRHCQAALQLREKWCTYFNGVGAVPWQNSMVK